MVKIIFDDCQNNDFDVIVQINDECSAKEAFRALYHGWLAATYLDSQFEDCCINVAKNGIDGLY